MRANEEDACGVKSRASKVHAQSIAPNDDMWTVLVLASAAFYSNGISIALHSNGISNRTAIRPPTGPLSLALAQGAHLASQHQDVHMRAARQCRDEECYLDKRMSETILQLEHSMHSELEAIHDIAYAQSAFEKDLAELRKEKDGLMSGNSVALGGASMKKRMADIHREAELRRRLHELHDLAEAHYALLNSLKVQRRAALLEQTIFDI